MFEPFSIVYASPHYLKTALYKPDIYCECKYSDGNINKYLIEIKNDFDSNYQNHFSLDALEQKFHVSKYRICREFTIYYDLSPIQYLNRVRIKVAKEALIYTDKRINEVGSMIGFDNTNHFIRLFKQQTGVTPLIFRKQPPAYSSFH